MDKKFVFIGLVLVLTILGLWFFSGSDEVQNVDPITIEKSIVSKPDPTPTIKKKVENKTSLKKETQSTQASSQVALERWEESKVKMKKRGQECEQYLNRFLPENVQLDPEDSEFAIKDSVIGRLNEMFDNSLSRPEIGNSYQDLQAALEQGQIASASDAYRDLADLDGTCRSFRSLNYLDVILEAGIVHKWTDAEKKELSKSVLEVLGLMIDGYFSASNMGYIVSVLEGMMGRGYLSREYSEEIQVIVQNIIDREDRFLDDFNEESQENSGKNMQVLMEHLKDNDSSGEELSEIIRRMKRNLSDS